jgi:hypothetical protein
LMLRDENSVILAGVEIDVGNEHLFRQACPIDGRNGPNKEVRSKRLSGKPRALSHGCRVAGEVGGRTRQLPAPRSPLPAPRSLASTARARLELENKITWIG